QTEIADVLERHPSTISRELRRNRGGRGYRPKQAQKLAHAACDQRFCIAGTVHGDRKLAERADQPLSRANFRYLHDGQLAGARSRAVFNRHLRCQRSGLIHGGRTSVRAGPGALRADAGQPTDPGRDRSLVGAGDLPERAHRPGRLPAFRHCHRRTVGAGRCFWRSYRP
ncbi:MAG: helix-turn-helix domain-containing protein, partial [Halothiobacillus sp.]|nr:helix-turn-helix domain-containing protein [Halothiobacillus sp.]